MLTKLWHTQAEKESFGSIINSHNNNFNFVRLIAATLVVVYHAFVLNTKTPNQIDPLTEFVSPHTNTGEIAVGTFFIVSGIFITQSWFRDANIIRFAIKRFARIVPGLFICLISTTIVAILFFSEQGWRGLFDITSWRFIFENALLHRLKDVIPSAENEIPGVYQSLNVRVMNGSLWTLFWEGRMYVFLALIGTSATMPPRLWFGGVAIFCLIAMMVKPELVTPYIWESRLFSLFMAGVLIRF